MDKKIVTLNDAELLADLQEVYETLQAYLKARFSYTFKYLVAKEDVSVKDAAEIATDSLNELLHLIGEVDCHVESTVTDDGDNEDVDVTFHIPEIVVEKS